jgi:Regulator of G protein signaling domain
VYVRELRRSVLVATPDLEKDDLARNVNIPRGLTPEYQSYSFDDDDTRPPHAGGGQIGDRNISPFLRSASRAEGEVDPPSPPHDSPESKSSARAAAGPQMKKFTGRRITRGDLRAAAEKILYTYILSGSEREVVLPREMVHDIQSAIEKDFRDDPEIFDPVREYIFSAMERQSFPRFLKAKALGNLVSGSGLMRLIFGLLALFGGLWTGFALIFLGYSRVTRCWVTALVAHSADSRLFCRLRWGSTFS